MRYDIVGITPDTYTETKYRMPDITASEDGRIREIHYYPVVKKGTFGEAKRLVHLSFDDEAVIRFFAQLGFTVTRKALKHNFEAWVNDYKSAYVDRENDLYMFTPCRHNDLRFGVCRLKGSPFENDESYIC